MYGSLYHVAADDIPATSITNKCIVLDLDQTLIATQDSIDSLKQFKILSNPQLIPLRNRVYYMTIEDLEKPGIGSKYEFWGVTRPHIHEFLIFCFSYFKIVAVWSAGKRPYVEAIVDHIFKDIRPPHIVFTYDDIDIDSNGNIIKQLNKMINYDPIIKRNMSLANTFVIDDNALTFQLNENNGVTIPAYLNNPVLNVDALGRDDPTLLQLKYWLLQPEVVNSTDISNLDKSNIFAVSLENYKSKINSIPGYRFLS